MAAVVNARIKTSQVSRRRAAGQTAQAIASAAVKGANTTMKWTSRTWAGSPSNVDKRMPFVG
jgi:hypothetical protein